MIGFEVEGTVAVVTLQRAERRNALTPAMLDELCDAIARADASEARAIVLMGRGPVFCAGFDLDLCLESTDGSTMRLLLSGLSRAIAALRTARSPVVVAAHGAAIAGGCALLGGGDIVVSDRGAKFGYPVARLGVSPAVSGPFATESLGPGGARSVMLDQQLFDGERAWRMGLVHELVDERGDAANRAMTIARELSAKPSAGLRATKGWLSALSGSLEAREQALGVSLALTGSEEERHGLKEALRARA